MPFSERMALGVKRYRGLDFVGKAVAKFYAAEALSPQGGPGYPQLQHDDQGHLLAGMNHPELLLVPWTVFAVALAL